MSNELTNHSEQIDKLAAALAAAQGKFLPIKKSKAVEVSGTTKEGKPYRYKYAYAPLDEILNATRPALSENGLAIIQTTDEGDGGTLLKTSLIHSSGQWYNSYKYLGRFDKPQEFGGALTYYRRYEISTVLSVSSEEDDDANGITGNEAQYKQKPANRPNVDPATGEVQPAKKPQPKQDSEPVPVQPESKKPTNGNGQKQLNPQALFELVQKQTSDYYNDLPHLNGTIGGWPNFKDQDDVLSAVSAAVDHANKNEPVEA